MKTHYREAIFKVAYVYYNNSISFPARRLDAEYVAANTRTNRALLGQCTVTDIQPTVFTLKKGGNVWFIHVHIRFHLHLSSKELDEHNNEVSVGDQHRAGRTPRLDWLLNIKMGVSVSTF